MTATAPTATNRRSFLPAPPPADYAPPRATIDPDPSKSWIARARPLVMSHRHIFTGSLVLSFLSLIAQVEIPNLVGKTIDHGIIRRTESLTGLLVLILGLGVLRTVLSYGSRSLLFRTAYAIEYDLRTIVYNHLSRMSFGFFDRVQSGQLISRANSDIRSVQMYLTFAPSILVQCSIALIAFALMLSINVSLALVALSTMPVIYIIGVVMRQRIFPVSWLIQARLADVATVVDENVNGVRVVKSFASEQQQLSKLARAADRLQWATIKDADVRAAWAPAIENLPRLGTALILLYGGWMAIHGHTTVGTIVAFNAYVLMLQPPFRMLGMLIMMGQRAAASAQRIYEVLDEQPEIVDAPDASDLRVSAGVVRFRDVEFGYADEPSILSGLELHVQAGETLAIVGPTGSGKSTVARLLARFYDVRGGAVTIDEQDVRSVSLSSLRAQVGVVTDEPFLFSESIRDNIAYGRPDADIEAIVAAAHTAGADGFIRALPQGYDTVVGERGYTLSGGQRQRIALARSLLTDPPVLVLDDATSAVDVHVEEQIYAALRQVKQARTMIVIAHRLSTIGLADRVVLLDEGRIVAAGTHAELLANEPRYLEVLAQTMTSDDADAETGD